MFQNLTQWLANVRLGWIIIFCIVMAVIRFWIKGKGVQASPWWRKHKGLRDGITEISEAALTAVVLVAFIIRPLLIQAFFIPSGSMIPTLYQDDRIIVNKLSYRIGDPSFGDIVVFSVEQEGGAGGPVLEANRPLRRTFWGVLFGEDLPKGVERKDFIKRCIGTPGDSILIAGGEVKRNGEVLDEPYRKAAPDYALGTWKLPPGTVTENPVLVELWERGIAHKGDYVMIDAGGLRVNTEATMVPRSILDALMADPSKFLAPYTIPDEQYLMCGDNRRRSNDGHVWGTLHRSRIVGRAWIVWWRSLTKDWQQRRSEEQMESNWQ
jgi:signal peptidase I